MGLTKKVIMVNFSEIGLSVRYSRMSARVEKHLNDRNKIYILLVIFGSTLLLMIAIVSYLIVSKGSFQQKQTTTRKEVVVLTTISPRTTQGEIFKSALFISTNSLLLQLKNFFLIKHVRFFFSYSVKPI